jgi:cell division protein FtsL|tara:strand:- start:423 stop:731 length:309 start_codon:yes stop_codon:yes gene_type:complete
MDILVASLILSSIFIIILSYAVYNLIRKVENYEDVVQDQVQYLQNISNTITESKKYLDSLDARGIFQSDDEVGEFFSHMQKVQEELDRYMLPQNYGTKEEQS